jgi:tetratricopeptide (TPR) repeat protein
MKLVSLAVSGSILLLTFAVPAHSQTSTQQSIPKMTAQMFADGDLSIPMQTPSQVSTAKAAPVRELTAEEMGDLYMARKQYFEAAQAFKNLSDQNPRNAVYLNKLGIALHQQEALNLALKCYEKALKVNPHYADAQNNIGTIWYQRKRYGKAIRAYEKAIKIRDDMAVLYSNLGYAYFGDKKYEQSIVAFRTALARDPYSSSTTLPGLARCCRIVLSPTAAVFTSCWPSPSPNLATSSARSYTFAKRRMKATPPWQPT